jgi:hypothetical protein
MGARGRMRSFSLSLCLGLLGWGALGLGAAGCGKGNKGDCPQLDICGGSPASDTAWQVTSACQVGPVRPAEPGDVNDFMTMNPQAATITPPQPNPVVAQQTTSGDWCSSLVFTQNDEITNANLWHEPAQISEDPAKPSTIIFGKDGTYLTKLVFDVPTGRDFTHFTRRCLVANGNVNPTCDKLATALTAYYKPANVGVPATFGDIGCAAASDGGCDCTYTFTLEVDDSGQWAIDKTDETILVQDSTTLQFNGATMNAAATTTTLRSSLCAAGQQLELSGLRGGSLSNVQGLRTLGLTAMH